MQMLFCNFCCWCKKQIEQAILNLYFIFQINIVQSKERHEVLNTVSIDSFCFKRQEKKINKDTNE